MTGGHQQRVGAVHPERDVGGRGGVHHLFRFTAADPGVLVVVGQDGGVAGAQPQAGSLLPAGAEPDRLGELDVAEPIGEQGHAAAVFHRLQLGGVAGQDHLAACCLGQADQVGQVRAADHRGLVDRQQGARGDGKRAECAAATGQVAQELGGVVRHRDTGRQGVASGLRRRDADHRAEPGGLPRPAGCGQHVRLAGSGRRVDHRHALAVGQYRQRRRGLVPTQPGLSAGVVRVVREPGERVLEPFRVRAEHSRCVGASQARRALSTRLGEHAVLHRQLRAGGVPHSAVPLVDAAPVGAQQAARNLHRVRRLQAQHRLEL